MALQTVTTAPILLAIHLKFSQGVPKTDMSRASLSYLVTIPAGNCKDGIDASTCPRRENVPGRKLLWIHLCLLWYISLTWVFGLWWIAKGSLRHRRALIQQVRDKEVKEKAKAREDSGAAESSSTLGETTAQGLRIAHGMPTDESRGWRQRTLMVMNLPTTMRDEASIRRYFEEFLRPDDASIMSGSDGGRRSREVSNGSTAQPGEASTLAFGTRQRELSGIPSDKGLLSNVSEYPPTLQQSPTENVDGSTSQPPLGPEPDVHPDRHMLSPVQTVVLVRKMNELSAMLARRQEVLGQLEAAHIKLAQNVMSSVGKRTTKLRKRRGKAGTNKPVGMDGVGLGRPDDRAPHDIDAGAKDNDNGVARNADIEKSAADLHGVEVSRRDELAKRLARFSPSNKGHHTRETQMLGDGDSETSEMQETVWEALHAIPRDLLDPYQPVTRLSALFRGQTVPTIDYLLTKLNLLTALVTEMRARPPTSYDATSTAFVTFRDPRQARMVWRELKSQIVIKVRLAPEVKDLDWERLMRTSFTGDVVRGLGVNTFFWAFTIFWVIPVQLITTSLFSLSNLKLVVPGLASYFDSHKSQEAFVSVTLPTVIVSLITMAVPELIFQISKRAQGFVTFSKLYDQCLCR